MSHIPNVLSVLVEVVHVGVTWESLNRVRNKLESEILQTEEEQARLFAKLS
jgi:hypothetical protein